MARSIVAGLAVLAGAASIATPAIAAAPPDRSAKVVYGIAWADGPRTLRITPLRAEPVRLPGRTVFRLHPLDGARELRFRYTGADYRRVTARCDLKENEGVTFLDRNGLGRTRCKDRHLAFMLAQGPLPVRITVGRGRLLVQEFLAAGTQRRLEYGTLTRLNDNTVWFRTPGKTYKLGYSPHLGFSRVTRHCGDRWLANRVNSSPAGLGTKPCTKVYFNRALPTGKPVPVRIDYRPLWHSLDHVWEIARR